MKLRHALPLALLTLTACVNEGNKLEALRFTSTTDLRTPLTTSITSYLCFPQVPTLIGEFTDGSLGDFARRADRYVSSDPSKLVVSNGDVALPDGTGFYVRGAMIPQAITNPGGIETPVTITATFAGLSASVQVVVHQPGPVVLAPVPTIATATGPFMAPGSALSLKATSSFDGQPVTITGSGTWSFDTATGDDTIATIGAANAVVSGFAPGTRNAKFALSDCPDPLISPLPVIAPLPVTVAAIDHIEIAREFAPTAPVLVSKVPSLRTSEAITTTAFFDAIGTEKQDLTGQAALSLTPSDTKAFQFVSLNLLSALQEFDPTSTTPMASLPPVTVTATFKSPNTDTGTTFTDNVGPISAKEANLQSIAIDAAQQNQVIPGFSTLAFTAIGTFIDNADGTTVLSQPLTRHAAWSVSDTTVAFIGNTLLPLPANRGVLTSLKNADGCVTVTADTQLAVVAGATIATSTLLGVGAVTQPCTPTTTP